MNKADRPGADEVVGELLRMLDMGPAGEWRPPVLRTVATSGEGVADVWDAVAAHRRHLASGDGLARRRSSRAVAELESALHRRLREQVSNGDMAGRDVLDRVVARELDPWTAAESIVAGNSAPVRPG